MTVVTVVPVVTVVTEMSVVTVVTTVREKNSQKKLFSKNYFMSQKKYISSLTKHFCHTKKLKKIKSSQKTQMLMKL